MATKCFYHSVDKDGHCSGALVKHYFPGCEMIGIDHGQPFPLDQIINEDVWMVDFALQPFEQMFHVKRAAANFVWIDHHESAINAYEDFIGRGVPAVFPEISGRRAKGNAKAACELTWKFLYPDKEMPKFVEFIGRYDVWDHHDPGVLPFQFGIRIEDTDPTNQYFWNEMLNRPKKTRSIYNAGKIVMRFIERDYKAYAKTAFETVLLRDPVAIDGGKITCLAINRSFTSSQLFDSIWDEKKFDAMLTFGWRDGQWTVSLYSTSDLDVSAVAKAYGGGGHKQAAGFQCKKLPFALN